MRWVFLPGLLVACASTPLPPERLQVDVEVRLREPALLPPQTVLEISAADVAKADAPAAILARERLAVGDATSLQGTLHLRWTDVQAPARVSLRARLLSHERVLAVSDTAVFVRPDQGQQRHLLQVTRVGTPPPPPQATPENTYWKLVELRGQSVLPSAREAHLILQPDARRVVGSGSCNRFQGSYERDGAQLRFGKLASTLMACDESAALEQRFFDMLDAVQAWRRDGDRLDLLDASGAVVARFQAVWL